MWVAGIAIGLTVAFGYLWRYWHKPEELPVRRTGEQYHSREYFNNRPNGHISDSGSSGPYR